MIFAKKVKVSVEKRPALPIDAKIDKTFIDMLPEELIKEFKAVVFDADKTVTRIAAVDCDEPKLKRFIAQRFPGKVVWYTATEDHIREALNTFSHDYRAEISDITLDDARADDNDDVVRLTDRIIRYAITEGASDMHIEPVKDKTVVRFRIDGMLHQMLTLPRQKHTAVISRLKILANLKIDEYRRPQDGRIEPEDLPNVSLRLSIMPTLYGEKAAMRILDDSHKNLSLESLGFSKSHEKIIMANLEKPYGMIVTSGPTGSGKTTTLYGLLNLLGKSKVNISTLEDPIEFALPGINQIQINPRVDLTFASGLRSLLRQDPDIIMVGEIRDSETAVMAANAALTGHLVLTTIHTNDAASVFPRFLEMKVDDFVVGSVVNLVIAQRLVRRVCAHCSEPKFLDEVVIEKIKKRPDILAVFAKLEKKPEDFFGASYYYGKGCDKCMGIGYHGRIGLYELLEQNQKVHDLVMSHASGEDIALASAKKGNKSIVDDGIEKVINGITTFDEVLRATKSF
jgi:type II secretory ATPase GspE/PulE/Tfp pilus assembly ATPase PilB-like protein